MTKEQILNAFYLAVYEAGLADSNAALKLDCCFQRHLDEVEKKQANEIGTMTVNELIGKLSALPEEQREMDIWVSIDPECIDDVVGASVRLMAGGDVEIFLGKYE